MVDEHCFGVDPQEMQLHCSPIPSAVDSRLSLWPVFQAVAERVLGWPRKEEVQGGGAGVGCVWGGAAYHSSSLPAAKTLFLPLWPRLWPFSFNLR